MHEHELEEQIRQAFSHAAPDLLDAVLSDCNESKGQGNTMTKTHKRQPWTRLAGLAACLVLLVGGTFGVQTYRADHTVDATVSLDVNPSVELQVNRKERVLAVTALNEDGAVILGDMDLSGSDLKVAVNALVGSMLQNGYLSELANSILISVDSGDSAQGAALQAALAAQVNELLQSDAFHGAVLSQTITYSDDLQELADCYGITLGKAQLIQEILAAKPSCTFEDLAPLTINELNLLRAGQAESAVESVGTASEKAYIGQDTVRQLVLEHAGVASGDATRWEIELDTEHGVLVYDVEFDAAGFEYEYQVNAVTGQIVSAEKEADGHAADHTVQTPTSSGAAQSQDTQIQSTPTQSAAPTQSAITQELAKELALAHAGVASGDVTHWEVELDTEHGVQIYEIEFRAGGYEYEYQLNAATGEILKAEKEADDHTADHTAQVQTSSGAASAAQSQGSPVSSPSGSAQAQSPSAAITQEQARELALAHAGVASGDATHWELKLDTEHGVQVYKVEFQAGGYEYEYKLNAATGEILKAEKDRD
jgi:uncharacterized membrane protein YkoI